MCKKLPKCQNFTTYGHTAQLQKHFRSHLIVRRELEVLEPPLLLGLREDLEDEDVVGARHDLLEREVDQRPGQQETFRHRFACMDVTFFELLTLPLSH